MLKNFFKAFVFVIHVYLRNLWIFVKKSIPYIIFVVAPLVLTNFIVKAKDLNGLWAFGIVFVLYLLESLLWLFLEYIYDIAKYAQKHNCDINQAYEAVNAMWFGDGDAKDETEVKTKIEADASTIEFYPAPPDCYDYD